MTRLKKLRADLALWASLVLAACATTQSGTDEHVASLERQASAHNASVNDAEAASATLSSKFASISVVYAAARNQYDAANEKYQAAASAARAATANFDAARQEWNAATTRWKAYQVLVQIAALVDAHNLEKLRSVTGRSMGDVSCERVTTRAYRRHLASTGTSMPSDMHVDHIVPRALGGADHPWNYQLLPAGENIAWSDTFNLEKCTLAGPQCALAVAISVKCGTYRP